MDIDSLMRKRENVTHYISSGSLQMDKRFFAKELLKSESFLRELLGYDNGNGTKVKEIIREDNTVKIVYGRGEVVFVPDDVNGYFDEVKAVYSGSIHGAVTVAMSYGNMDFLDVTITF